ncbi:MAG: hypothetical protein M1821_001027 [Bathelium mastoideum]|nr:MAG: hypothetical protein M1821_001027 [Bathelium mastoideum]
MVANSLRELSIHNFFPAIFAYASKIHEEGLMGPITRKRKVTAVEEVTFDEAAREEYLTGFHKRKQQRIKHAQEAAAKRERDERIEERKQVGAETVTITAVGLIMYFQIREQRRKQLEEHVNAVNSLLRQTNGNVESNGGLSAEGSTADDEEWQGFGEPLEVHRVDEYIDEDKYALVTVESVDVAKDGLHVTAEDDEEDDQSASDAGNHQVTVNGRPEKKRVWTKERPAGKKPKKKKFRYESVAERKVERQKQKARNAKAAKVRRGK